MTSFAPIKPRYPTEATIARMIRAARKAGLDVAGFDALPDGTIRIMDARAMPNPPAPDLFAQLDAEGKI
jgi:hypothetical protein